MKTRLETPQFYLKKHAGGNGSLDLHLTHLPHFGHLYPLFKVHHQGQFQTNLMKRFI